MNDGIMNYERFSVTYHLSLVTYHLSLPLAMGVRA